MLLLTALKEKSHSDCRKKIRQASLLTAWTEREVATVCPLTSFPRVLNTFCAYYTLDTIHTLGCTEMSRLSPFCLCAFADPKAPSSRSREPQESLEQEPSCPVQQTVQPLMGGRGVDAPCPSSAHRELQQRCVLLSRAPACRGRVPPAAPTDREISQGSRPPRTQHVSECVSDAGAGDSA